MSETGIVIEWWWIAIIVVIGGAAAAFDLESRVLKRRLLVAMLFLFGAASFAYSAIANTVPVPPGFSEEVRIAARVLALAASAWTLYLGIDTLRTWWRIGDKTDES